jgi:hypothetical protein
MRGGRPGTSGHVPTQSSIRKRGMLDQSGVDARTVLCLTRGGRPAVRPQGGLREEVSAPIGRPKSAEGLVGTQGRAEGPNGWQEGAPDAGPKPCPWTAARAARRGAEGDAAVGASGRSPPVGDAGLMARVVERGHLLAALRRVKRNGGSPGIDGMTVEERCGDLREHWPRIRVTLVAGTYRPQPVRRGESPKPGGGVRPLGIPTGLDRFIPQA